MAATVDLASVSASLSQVFAPRIIRQINRHQGLLAFLPKRVGSGKNCAWTTEFNGAVAAGGAADGSDIAGGEYGSDEDTPAILNWGNYRGAFRIGSKAQAAALSSHSPEDLRGLWFEKMFGSISKMGDTLNKDLFAGTGAADFMFGLQVAGGPLDDTGSYATIDRTDPLYTEWQGNKLFNGAISRSLTEDLIRDSLRVIFERCGETPDLIVCDPPTWDRVGTILNQDRRALYDVKTRAGEITMQGGWHALEFDGIPVVRDKDVVVPGAANREMLFLNTNHLWVEFLPTFRGQQNDEETGLYTVHDDKGAASGLPLRLNLLGKTGQSDKAFVEIFPQLKCDRPNSMAWLGDLQLT